MFDFEAITARCTELAALPDDWDSYNGQPCASTAITAALTFCRQLTEAQPDCPDPWLDVGPAGTLALSWSIGADRALIIDFDAQGRGGYLVDCPDQHTEEYDDVPVNVLLALCASYPPLKGSPW